MYKYYSSPCLTLIYCKPRIAVDPPRISSNGDTISRKRKGKKGVIESRGETGGCLISAYKKDIPQVDSSRSVFIPDRCRVSLRNANCIIIDTSSRFFSQRSHRHTLFIISRIESTDNSENVIGEREIKVNFPMYFLDKQKENEIVIISGYRLPYEGWILLLHDIFFFLDYIYYNLSQK